MKLFIITIFIIIFFLIKNSIGLYFVIDFNTNILYNNSKCGDINIYPPCKNLNDVSNRVSQIDNQDDIKLDILIYNPMNKKEIIVNAEYNSIGEIKYYYNISIRMVDKNFNKQVGTTLIIDGMNSISSFLTLSENNQNFLIQGIHFINWYNNTIVKTSKGFEKYNSNVILNFQNCIFNNIKKIIDDTQDFVNSNNIQGLRDILFSNCSFKNINTKDYNQNLTFLNSYVINVINTQIGFYFTNIINSDLFLGTFFKLNENSTLKLYNCFIYNNNFQNTFIDIIGNNTSVNITNSNIYLNSIGRLVYLYDGLFFNFIEINLLNFFRNDVSILVYSYNGLNQKFIFELFSTINYESGFVNFNNNYIENNYNGYDSGIMALNNIKVLSIHNSTVGEELKQGFNITNTKYVKLCKNDIDSVICGVNSNFIVYNNNVLEYTLKLSNCSLTNIDSDLEKKEKMEQVRNKNNMIILLSILIPLGVVVSIVITIKLFRKFNIHKIILSKTEIELEEKAKTESN